MVQQRVGPQLLNVLIKQDEAAKFVAKKLGVPEELIRSPEEMQQASQQFQEMMAQQQGESKENHSSNESVMHNSVLVKMIFICPYHHKELLSF